MIDIHPFFRADDDLLAALMKPGAPPREGRVGNDMVLAVGHQLHVSIVFRVSMPIYIDNGMFDMC